MSSEFKKRCKGDDQANDDVCFYVCSCWFISLKTNLVFVLPGQKTSFTAAFPAFPAFFAETAATL